MEQSIRSHRFTEARNNLTAIIDAVQGNDPQIILKRKNSEDDVFIIKASLLRRAFSLTGRQRFKSKTMREEDGSWTITLEPFSLVVNAPTRERAAAMLLEDVRTYVEDFLELRSLYLQSPNRKYHLPFVIQVILCPTDAELRETLHLA